MRPTPLLRALPTPSRTNNLSLLPPIPLYRRLLRAHRKHLPYDARALGDAYVKSEFRLHRNVDNPIHIVGFLTEWQLYVQQLEGEGWRQARMEKEKLEKMSDDQIVQMYEMLRILKGESSGPEAAAAADENSTTESETTSADTAPQENASRSSDNGEGEAGKK